MSSFSAAAPGPRPMHARRGSVGGRLSHRRVLVMFSIGLVAFAGLATIISALSAPSPIQPLCKPYQPCGTPPRPGASLVDGQVWTSASLGFRLAYPADVLQIAQQGPDEVVLESTHHVMTLIIRGRPASQASPQRLFDDELASLGTNLTGFALDGDPTHRLLGANVGLRPGPGGAYGGTESPAAGPVSPKSVDVMSAGDGQVSVLAELIVDTNISKDLRKQALGLADYVFNTVEWRSDLTPAGGFVPGGPATGKSPL